MTATLLEEIQNAPDEPVLFDEPELEAVAAPARTSETRAKGRGSRTRERECENCGETYVGGHKLCPDCKGTTAKPRTTTTSPRGSAKLEEDLLESTVSLASDISAVMPTVAGVLIARAEVAVQGMMGLAKGHPRVQKFLQKGASASKIADLMSTVAMVVIAAMVDIGRISIDSPILDRIGYADIVRDDKGKARKDPERGTIIKERRTLRDIHDMMTGEDTSQQAAPQAPGWQNGFPTVQPNTGTGPTTMPPMNWTP